MNLKSSPLHWHPGIAWQIICCVPNQQAIFVQHAPTYAVLGCPPPPPPPTSNRARFSLHMSLMIWVCQIWKCPFFFCFSKNSFSYINFWCLKLCKCSLVESPGVNCKRMWLLVHLDIDLRLPFIIVSSDRSSYSYFAAIISIPPSSRI